MTRTRVLTVLAFLALALGAMAGFNARNAEAAAFVVNSAGDAGDAAPGNGVCATGGAVCTLRAAIQETNALAGADVINFSIGAGAVTISPGSPLPTIIDPVTIDGTTQPGFAGSPIVEVEGSGVATRGFEFSGASANSVLEGLVVNRWGNRGVQVNVPGVRITRNHIGTNIAGNAALANGQGIFTTGGGSDVVIDRNLISGNTVDGVSLFAPRAAVRENFIGTNAAGTAAVPNGDDGIAVSDGGDDSIIGGVAANMNLISGNGETGVVIEAGASNVQVLNNRIGTNEAGTAGIGNGLDGIADSGANTLIGDTAAGSGNLISGNGANGINLITSSGTRIHRATIGTNLAGTAAVPNALGIFATNSTVTIGTTQAGVLNLVSGNGSIGINLANTVATVQGTFIGTNAAGGSAIPNGGHGVQVSGGSNGTVIGTLTTTNRNVISGNTQRGVNIVSSGIAVRGNVIGTDLAGTSAIANADGISIVGNNNTIGGTTQFQGNVISGNTGTGVRIDGGSGNVVISNHIGLNINDNAGVANGTVGVFIGPGSSSNRIGGPGQFENNFISGNGIRGVQIEGSSNQVLQNRIGTNGAGTAAIPNGQGVAIFGSNNLIGGQLNQVVNVISGNAGIGVLIGGGTGNQVAGNLIGTNAAGNGGLGNGASGVSVSANNNTIGGLSVGEGNIISSNTGNGVTLFGGATGNILLRNFIGTDVNGTADLGNGAEGVELQGVSNNTIGGLGNNTGNLISGNSFDGVAIGGGGTNNTVINNFIGTNAAGTAAIPNDVTGVVVFAAANGNVIGGTDPNARNVISGNGNGGIFLVNSNSNQILRNLVGTNVNGTALIASPGIGIRLGNASNNTIGTAGNGNTIAGHSRGISIEFIGGSSNGNVIRANRIGTNSTGTGTLGNTLAGIHIQNGQSNTIGGTGAGEGNLISGNANGIVVDPGSSNNTILGNFIGTNVSGGVDLGNAGEGIQMSGANNTIGGTASGAGNLISGNDARGIFLTSTGNTVLGNLIGTNAAGGADLGNTADGIGITGNSNTIGGTAAGARNLISGNDQNGIRLVTASASANLIQGNFIGTNAAGTADLGNSLDGVSIGTGPNNVIGGGAAGAGNLISGNDSDGVDIAAGSAGNQVLGNMIGTDAAGGADLGNTSRGILVSGGNGNIIGGAGTAGNVVSGNNATGIDVTGTTGTQIIGNTVGLNAAGTAAIGNTFDGIALHTHTGTLVTGNRSGGNGDDGLDLFDTSSNGHTVQANFFGTNATGAALGNADHGVEVFGQNNLIGGTGGGQGNTMRSNGGDGVMVFSGAAGNRILGNSIFSNGGLGIDLTNDGVTLNDGAGDLDGGANTLQNFPVLNSADISTGVTRVQGTLATAENTTFRVEVFMTPACDGSGFGEGQTFLGNVNVTTDAAGTSSFLFETPTQVPANQFVTATATSLSGPAANNTSEFSQCRVVPPLENTPPPVQQSDLSVTLSDAPDPAVVGQTLTYTAVVFNAGPRDAGGVTLTDLLPSSVTFVGAEGTGARSAQASCTGTTTVTCTIGNLTSGASATVVIRVTPNSPGVISNSVSVSGTPADPNSGNNSASTTTTVTTPVANRCPGFESLPGNHILGSAGDDNIAGTAGNDVICAFAGADQVTGAAGDDVILGGAGNDILDGGAGSDRVGGQTGHDTLVGGDGADQLWGADGTDRLRGGRGNDGLHGGGGYDWVSYPGSFAVRVDLAAGTATGIGAAAAAEIGSDTLTGDNFIAGSSAADVLRGSNGVNRILGGGGGDEIRGRGGNDTLEGGAGADTLTGDSGQDVLLGGTGNDDFFLADGVRDTANGEGGSDAACSRDAVDSLVSIELTGCP